MSYLELSYVNKHYTGQDARKEVHMVINNVFLLNTLQVLQMMKRPNS